MNTFNKFLTPIAIFLAGVVIAGALIFTRSKPATDTDTTAATEGQQAPAVNIKDVNVTNEPYIGNANAPVTLAYWSDYQCPYCKEFETTVLPQLITNYVNAGKLKVVFKDFQFLDTIPGAKTQDSQIAGQYGRAIWQLYPNQYFAWREAMYSSQDEEDTGFGDEQSIIALTKTIAGIDVTKVEQAVAQNKTTYQKEIDADKTEGEKMGIEGTPAFIVGNQLITGAEPYATFSQDIDTQLK